MSKLKKKELSKWFTNVVAVYDRYTTDDASVFYSDEYNEIAALIQALDLVEKLKFFMARTGLTTTDVANLIKKDYKTVWQFLRRKVKPQDGTAYSIKKLIGGDKE